MTAKAYMEQVQIVERELRMIAEQREHYLALGGALAANLSATPGSHDNHSRVEVAAVGMADLAAELEKKAAGYVAFVREARDKVEQLEAPNFRQVLIYHYFLGKPMKEISDIMQYKDGKSVYRVRGYALRELDKLMK